MNTDHVFAPIKLLFVTSDKRLSAVFERAFLAEGCDLVGASDAKAARRALEIEKIDIIVVDEDILCDDDEDVLRRASRMRPLVKRVLLTTHGDLKAALDAINRGRAQRFVIKPLDDEQLHQVVSSLLGEILRRRWQELMRAQPEDALRCASLFQHLSRASRVEQC